MLRTTGKITLGNVTTGSDSMGKKCCSSNPSHRVIHLKSCFAKPRLLGNRKYWTWCIERYNRWCWTGSSCFPKGENAIQNVIKTLSTGKSYDFRNVCVPWFLIDHLCFYLGSYVRLQTILVVWLLPSLSQICANTQHIHLVLLRLYH